MKHASNKPAGFLRCIFWTFNYIYLCSVYYTHAKILRVTGNPGNPGNTTGNPGKKTAYNYRIHLGIMTDCEVDCYFCLYLTLALLLNVFGLILLKLSVKYVHAQKSELSLI